MTLDTHDPKAAADWPPRSLAVATAALLAAGCGSVGYTEGTGDQTNGKELFIAKCGSCHMLADAGTTGQIGPNLDDAFRESRRNGLGESTIVQVVRGQIAYPIAKTSTGAPGMPADLVRARTPTTWRATSARSPAGSPAGTATPLGPDGGSPTTWVTGRRSGHAAAATTPCSSQSEPAARACHELADADAAATSSADLGTASPSSPRARSRRPEGGNARAMLLVRGSASRCHGQTTRTSSATPPRSRATTS